MTASAGWRRVPIGSLADLYDGPHATPKPSDEGPVFLGIRNITEEGRLDLSEIRHIADEDYPRWTRRVEPRAGDIVFIYEAGLHRYAVIPEGFKCCLGRRTALLRPHIDKVDARFLVYYLLGDDWRATVSRNVWSGATVDRIPLTNFPSFELSLPPLRTQRKIAAILSAYDDLIENNTRRIAILEELARLLYRDWFVNFRFPGHESVRMMESELGLIPEGWEVATVEDTFGVVGGGTPSKPVAEYWVPPAINWYTPSDLTATGAMFFDLSGTQISTLGLQRSSARLFPPFSVMMTSRATLGVISINTTEATTNQGFITCIPNHRFPLYLLYHWLSSNVDEFIALASGATFKEITKGTFKKIQLAVPTADLARRFQCVLEPFGELILSLLRSNANLRQTRDLLLPRLISGELDVEDLEIQVPEEAA